MSDVNTQVAEILRAVLELPDDADVSGLKKAGTAKWDSLAQVTLVAVLEDSFGITLEIADYARMDSFAALCALVAEKRG